MHAGGTLDSGVTDKQINVHAVQFMAENSVLTESDFVT